MRPEGGSRSSISDEKKIPYKEERGEEKKKKAVRSCKTDRIFPLGGGKAIPAPTKEGQEVPPRRNMEKKKSVHLGVSKKIERKESKISGASSVQEKTD